MSITGKIVNFLLKITSFLPRRNIIIFESSPNFSDNTYWFFKYLIENTDISKKYKLVWMVKTEDEFRDTLCGQKIRCIARTNMSTKNKFFYMYYYNFAKFIIDSNLYVEKQHPAQKRIYLGHGMPLKSATEYVMQRGDVDMNMITTYYFNDFFYKTGHTDNDLRNYGYPRNDILAKNAGIRKNRDVTNIVWMPTYRQHTKISGMRIDYSFPLGIPVIKSAEDMKEINCHLKENNTILYLRPHPAQDISMLKLEEMSNIIIADTAYLESRNLQLYEFLAQTDALISDYSSVYYDYLLLERPIALAAEDLEEFCTKWPIVLKDLKANYRCEYIETVDEMKSFITDVASDEYKFMSDILREKKLYNDYTDGKSCERIYNFMVKEYKL